MVLFLDPLYTVSADVDHARENLRAQASLDRVVRIVKPCTAVTFDFVLELSRKHWRPETNFIIISVF